MTRALTAISGATALALAIRLAASAQPAPVSGKEALDKFALAWQGIHTYRCTITSHEVSGSRVQDRVYHLAFAKPHDTRLDIVGGEGRGGVAVWRGGDTVRGHQGGLLAAIKLRLGLHARLTTSLRGTTVADANWGSLYGHVTSLRPKSSEAETRGDETAISLLVADPSTDNAVTKEVLILGKDSLPVEFDQFEGNQQVKRVKYSEVRLNVALPGSTWSL